MVEVNYCPKCDQTSREHFAREMTCPKCGKRFKRVTVPLPLISWAGISLFVAWLPLLVVGFFQYIGNAGETRYLGYIAAGVILAVISILLQMTGSRQVLKKALTRAQGTSDDSEVEEEVEEEEPVKVEVAVRKKIIKKEPREQKDIEEKPQKAVKKIRSPIGGRPLKKTKIVREDSGIRDMSEILAEKRD